MIEVELPDGSIAEFPDGTSPDVIKGVLQRRVGVRQNTTREQRIRQKMIEEKDLIEMTDPSGSALDNARAGYAKSWLDTGRGLKQIGLGIADYFDPPKQDLAGLVTGQKPMGRADRYQQELDQNRYIEAPLMDTLGGITGNVTGQGVQMAVPGTAVSKAGLVPKVLQGTKLLPSTLRAAASAGAFGATQPVHSGESRAGNAAWNAAFGGLGNMAFKGAAALGKGSADKLAPEVLRLAQKAEQLGIPLSRAQLSDSRFMKVLSSAVRSLPFSGANKMGDKQAAAFTRAVARTFGEDTDRITTDVALSAKQRIGGMFDKLSARNRMGVDQKLMGDVIGVLDDAKTTGTPDNFNAVQGAVDRLLAKTENGTISGSAYREFRTWLGRQMKSMDGDKRHYLGQVRSAVDDAMERHVSPADAKAWKGARGQYKALKTVEDMIAKSDTGELRPQLLLNLVRRANKDMAYGGGGDLADLARIAQRFMKEPPDSGTAPRQMILGGLGALTGSGAIDPVSALAAIASGRGLNAAINSPASGRLMLQGSATARRALPALRALPFLLPGAANAAEQ